MTPEFWIQLLGVAGVGAGIYAAIKADLVNALVTAKKAMSDADEAHKRLDSHIDRHHTNGVNHA